MSFAYESDFPFGEVREAQRKAIDFALDAFVNKGKRFVVIEAGTGVGKSAIGLTIARHLNKLMPEQSDSGYKSGAYFLTTQKILQEQYVRDFGEESGGKMCQVMSSTNYQCKFHKRQSCAESMRQLKLEEDKQSKFARTCMYQCTYKLEKQKFMASAESVTNFSYFLAETSYAGKLVPRSLLVIDEAHNTDTELCGFIEISMSERFAKTALKIEMPDITTEKGAWRWIVDEYEPRLKAHVKHYEEMIEKFNLADKVKTEFANIAKQYEMLDKHICKVHRFMELYNEENWVFNLAEGEGRGMRRLEFKPIDVSGYADHILFKNGRRVLMMSATILNKEGFCKTLGITENDCEFISIPSPFPPENHPIMAFPIAKMSAATIDQDLPKLAEAVRSILSQHPNEKGIIHCVDGNSMISMSDGTQKPLIEISPGDEIITWNEAEGKFENSVVVENWDKGIQECVDIHMEDGRVLSCTPEHRILTKNRGWVEARELTVEDDIVKLFGERMRISRIEASHSRPVRDLTVLKNHNFVASGVVVHNCHTFKIAKYLQQHVKSDRLLIHGSEDRIQKLQEHMSSKKPTVLLSPSMQEGVDLKDDLSRFQIICKVPYPYLGDKIVKKRMHRWPWWYPLQTAKTIVQSIGRSVRSQEDHAVSYILDADWDRFYSRNDSLFPESFRNSLKG